MTTFFHKEAISFIENDSQIKDDLAKVLEINTSFPPGNTYRQMCDLVEEMLSGFPVDFQRITIPKDLWQTQDLIDANDRVNLIAKFDDHSPPLDGCQKEICSIYFHTDTVPPGDGWDYPPIAATFIDDKIYGRGAADMKGSIASTLAALRAIYQFKLPLRFLPELLFCTDEENGIYPGIRYLAEQNMVGGHLLNFNGKAEPRIWEGCFGSVNLIITIHGKACHSAEPHLGSNAIENAIPLLNSLNDLKQRVNQQISQLTPPPHYKGRPLHGLLSITACEGGDKGSSIPGKFSITLNRRYTPEENYETVIAEIENTVDAILSESKTDYEIEIVGHLPPVSDPTGPLWDHWIEAQVFGFGYDRSEFKKYGAPSSSDMGWVQKLGVQEILLGGLIRSSANVHGANEHTTMSDVMNLAKSVLFYLVKN